MIYYTFFHPTGVEVQICCWKRNTRAERESGNRPPVHHEAVETSHPRPHVLDLGEAEVRPHREEEAGNGNGGTDEPTSYVKSKSRLSVSRWEDWW